MSLPDVVRRRLMLTNVMSAKASIQYRASLR